MGAFSKIFQRLRLTADTSVTTQTSTVIQADTTNASLVLTPNGTGAIIASVPDGTDAGGGNARGNGAVDLQLSRYNKVQVASGNFSFIGGGANNRATGVTSVCVGGDNNFSTGLRSFVGSGTNVSASGQDSVAVGGNTITCAATGATVGGGVSNNIPTSAAAYSTISGGQSNTASTNTHATVVGGGFNTSSGQYSVSGGNGNVVSGNFASIAFGYQNTVSGQRSGAIGYQNNIASDMSFAAGRYNKILADGYASVAIGNGGLSYLQGQFSQQANTNGTDQGQKQASQLVPYNSAALTTAATTILSLDGTGTTNLIIPNGNNRAWNVQIDTIAVVTAITGTATGVSVGDVYSEVKNLLFKRIGGTSSIVGTVDTSFIKSNSGMSTAALTVTAGASQEMALTFTSPTFSGGGSLTIRVVSKVSLVEVAY